MVHMQYVRARIKHSHGLALRILFRVYRDQIPNCGFHLSVFFHAGMVQAFHLDSMNVSMVFAFIYLFLFDWQVDIGCLYYYFHYRYNKIWNGFPVLSRHSSPLPPRFTLTRGSVWRGWIFGHFEEKSFISLNLNWAVLACETSLMMRPGVKEVGGLDWNGKQGSKRRDVLFIIKDGC